MPQYEKVQVDNKIPALIHYFHDIDFSDKTLYEKTAPHWHRSIELSYVQKGVVYLYVNGKKNEIKQGEFIFVNSGVVHELETDRTIACEVVMVIISYAFLKKVCPNFEQYYFNINKSQKVLDRLQDIYQQIKKDNLKSEAFCELKTMAYLYEIVYLLLHDCVEELATIELKAFKQQQHAVLDYIEEHYQEDLSLKNLAVISHMSEEHFSRTFQHYFGINFKKYITNYRLSCAYQDVLRDDYTIQEVAMKHGFSNIKSFITEFKKTYGQTPYQYRIANTISKKDNICIK